MESYEKLKTTPFEQISFKKCCIIRSGSTPADRNNNLKSGTILFKTTDIRNKPLIDNEYYYISNFIHQRMKKTSIHKKDILLNIVGATLDVIGRSAFINKLLDKNEGNITQAMVLLRLTNEKILPGYLFSYLNTRFAQDQMKRYARPTGQYNLNLAEIGLIIIPKLPIKDQTTIEKLILLSEKKLFTSQDLYTQAKQLLEQELGLDKLKFKKPVGYEASFSEVVNNNRADAEFYHIQFEPIINTALNYKNGWLPLCKVSNYITPNIDVQKFDKKFAYIEIGDVNISDGTYDFNKIHSNNLPANAKIKLRGGEIIISQVRPTRGAIAIVDDALNIDT
ncbi:MAG: hypothetical protein J7L46_04255, partial [Bacteroidales bacterium]|nr:hypothetical protein [Bacteroidales bacterium]